MEEFRVIILVLGVAFGTFSPSIILADSVVEQIDNLQVDWGALKVRFFGTCKLQAANESLPYAEIEKRAVSEGLLYVRDRLMKIHKTELTQQGVPLEFADRSALAAGEALTRNAYTYQTSYFKDSVRVFLESPLPKAWSRADIAFRKAGDEKAKESRFSGLILNLDKSVKPTARYQIVDQSGAPLFGPESMTKGAYEKNLMGRWLAEPQREELIKYVGARPVSVQVKVVQEAKAMIFKVEKSAWTDALQDSLSVLDQGNIALVVPK